MSELERLQALADDRDKKRYLFELELKSQRLQLRMAYLCLGSTLAHKIPQIDYGLSSYGEATARFYTELFHRLQ